MDASRVEKIEEMVCDLIDADKEDIADLRELVITWIADHPEWTDKRLCDHIVIDLLYVAFRGDNDNG